MRIAILAAAACLALAGCNTVEGFGRDLSQVGDALSDASRDVRDGTTSKAADNCAPGSRRPSATAPCAPVRR